jgi:multisubunit Na+/H+ antiporter MnhC subunit
MLHRLLPRTGDNAYLGSRLALWLFGALLLMRLAMSVNSIFNGADVLQSADGIPLDTYPPDAAGSMVALFALLGLARLVTIAIGVLVLVRYRSLVPLMFALLLLEHAARALVLHFVPITRGAAPVVPVINSVLLALMSVGLALSLWERAGADRRRHTLNPLVQPGKSEHRSS